MSDTESLREMLPLSSKEVDDIEREIGFTIPEIYRDLLQTYGFGDWDSAPTEEFAKICSIYDPREVRGLYSLVFDEGDDDALFRDFFPFGSDEDAQEMWIIDVRTGLVASIWHELHPEQWTEEEWMSPDEWRARYLSSLVE